MAKSANRWGRAEVLVMLRDRGSEASGFALLLVCLLLFLTLVTYDPRDGSLNTAVDAAPHNFLGHDGAVLADLLWQCLGVASFVIPILLLAWAFRLMLHRPLRSIWTRMALFPVVLILASVAVSVLDLGALAPLAGPGGAIGWGLHRILVHSGLGTAALPISWYETENIHQLTIDDFRAFVAERGITVENAWFLTGNRRISRPNRMLPASKMWVPRLCFTVLRFTA